MEVHHHGHVHHEKRWKSYLFQFFMLFLAVFLGFLAEYQLEHTIEKTREKDYIKLRVEDLQIDTSHLSSYIPEMKKYVRGLDTLIDQVYLYLDGKADTRLLYYTYHRYCRNRIDVELSRRALNQLKNSGNMRLIQDKTSARIIAGVESGFDVLDERTRFFHLRQEDASGFGMKIFDFKEYQKANQNADGTINKDENGFLLLTYQPKLNYTDPVYLKEFVARVGYYRNTFAEYINQFERAVPFVSNAITVLSKNYHIELTDRYQTR